jgi:hypothetical protein
MLCLFRYRNLLALHYLSAGIPAVFMPRFNRIAPQWFHSTSWLQSSIARARHLPPNTTGVRYTHSHMTKIDRLAKPAKKHSGLCRRAYPWLFGACALALAACSSPPTSSIPIPTITSKPSQTAPALSSPLPGLTPLPTGMTTQAPVATAAQVVATPTAIGASRTPSPGRGVVVGRAVTAPGQERHPSFIVSGELYLGTLVPAADPKLPPAIAVSPVDAPHAQVDQVSGAFIFSNVPPGTYALTMIGFSQSYVIEKPNNGGRIEVKVEANKTTELGDITLK